MKAFQYVDRIALDDLRPVELPTPSPRPRELLVRMRAASLNARDLLIATKRYGSFAPPLVPLSDGAGDVVEVGGRVTRFALGDLVIPTYLPDWTSGPPHEAIGRRRLGGPSPGVLAEYVVVHEDAAVLAPAHLSPIEASTLPIAAVTAWQVLFANAQLQPGEVVAVQGTGGVAVFVLQLARAAGAKVIVLTRATDRVARLEEMGAFVIDTTRDRTWEARVLELTAGRGVDLFVDLVGGDAVARAITATRVGGTVAIVGFVGGTTTTLDLVTAIRRVVTLRAVSGGSRASFEALSRALEVARIHPIVDTILPLSRTREAFMTLAERSPFGKVVITFDEETRS